jgi:hypothetical protein
MNKNKSQIFLGLAILLIDIAYNLINRPVLIGYLDRILIFIGLLLVVTGIFKEGIIAVFKKIHFQSKNRPHYFLLTVLIASLIIRITLLPERWINPVEGAHLYDAKFVLSGKIPFADYKSRMPVYVYLLAIFIKLFGPGYIIGRLLPLLSNIGIGVLIYFITNKLYASAIYLFSPLSILWAVVVKTELVATFFVSLGMYFLITNLKSEKERYGLLFFSGFFFALAFYVRKSALVFTLTPLILFIYFYKKSILKLIKAYGAVLFGYFSVVSLVFLYFGSFMGINPVLESGLNPSNVLADPLKKIGFSAEESSVNSEVTSNFRSKDQPFAATLWQWKSTIKLNLYLIIGLALSLAIFLQKEEDKVRFSYFFTYSWLFMLALFYLYYTFQRGFFTQYFGELLPPLSIIVAHVIYHTSSTKKISDNLKIIVLIILASTFLSSIFYVEPSFGSSWPPETVKVVSEFVILDSNPSDELMSGGVIWAFESDTRPFLDITHPLGFRGGMTDEEIKEVENQLLQEPPRYIILDGYTEQTFVKHVPMVGEEINNSFSIEKEIFDPKHKVIIYKLK